LFTSVFVRRAWSRIFFREFARALAGRRIVDQQIGIAQDGCEWVVDLMRGACGKLSK